MSKHILVVEDEAILSDMLKYFLLREGYRVTVANDGLDAQQKAEDLDDISLIISDLMLPYVGGKELLIWFRKHPKYQETPILILTGLQSEDDIVSTLDNGANDYITKPFQPRELHARIRRIMK